MTPRREEISHLITILHCRRTGRYGARIIEAATSLSVAFLTELDASRLTVSLFVPGSGRQLIGHMEDLNGGTLPVIPGGRKELDNWLGACGIGWTAHQMPPLDAGYRGAMYLARAMMQPDPDVTVFRAIVENALKESPSQAMLDIALAMATVAVLHKIRGGNPADIAFKAQLMRADGEESVGFAANVPLRVIDTLETDGSDYDPADIFKCRWTGDAEDAAPRVCTHCECTASEEFGAEYWQQLQPSAEGGSQP